MEVIEESRLMREAAEKWRRHGDIIAFVPTMGYLHQGHMELLRVGRERGDRLIMSIFVNPIQFGQGEDYKTYPRDPEGDLRKAKSAGVDAVFMPTVEEMYPQGFQSAVTVEELTRYLCGRSRPGHFEGVTTVVAKLFHITCPHIAIFGEKDYQQLVVIRRMVRDLDMGIDVIGVPTVRERDGLAMSSRNSYLSAGERSSALGLKEGLDAAKTMVAKGEEDAAKIKGAVRELILSHPFTEIEYISICDPETLTDVEIIDRPSLLALAVRVGRTRLIDNAMVGRN